ncbi:MAG: YidC/Oxa1 family membrane protein insertase [Patescibacteria group bacterium]|nr:YidC/Oxa1 family membrane protein insertase [Patescibacteria group bacterium]MCL5262162.1 YidC/Oxa1 family membrane protein insertase [Patescibacteria group bacterium]
MFNLLLYRPFLNLLVWISEHLVAGDFGLAIVILTVVVRFLLFPFFHKFLKGQQAMIKVQAEQKKIEAQYPGNKEKQLQAIMELYKANKINPFASLLLTFVQIPVIYALYKVIITGLNGGAIGNLYPFIKPTTTVNYLFLGLINLKESNTIMLGLALGVQLIQGVMAAPGGLFGKTTPELKKSRQTAINTSLMMTGLLALFFWKLPAAIGLYWLASTLFSIGQQLIVNKISAQNGEFKGNN